MSYQTLNVEMDHRGVLTIGLNRPQVRNAFDEKVIEELTHVFKSLESTVRVIVLRGEGPVFCAGGDLNWMKKAIDFSYEENLRDTRALAQMFSLMNECPQPVLGLVHGAAIGGGVGLVSICDKVIATQETQFSLSEVRLGIVPACISPFVIAKVGASHARGLFVSAERFSAQQAKKIGLVHEVVADVSALEAARDRLLTQILQCGPHAMATAKKLVLDLTWPERRVKIPDVLEYVARVLSDLRVSPEGQEGVRAFLEKRKPGWLAGN